MSDNRRTAIVTGAAGGIGRALVRGRATPGSGWRPRMAPP
jgi:NAD(P)-dependent dehydrogenase (short-subunit alcohol dehydrogenase family)